MSQSKYLLIGASCLAVGAALYYLSMDQEYVPFDPKIHTVEEIKKIMSEMFVEGATLYCQKLNLMRQMKNSGDFKDDTMDKMLEKQIKEMEEAELDIFKEYKVTEDVVALLLDKFGSDPEIKEKLDMLQQFQETVFDKNDMRITHVPIKNMPKGLDQDNYILIYRKQQECIRHEIYNIMKETGGATKDPAVQQAQQQRFLQVMNKKPEFQKGAFKLYDITLQEGDTRKIEFILREAYLDFYSLSLQKTNVSGVAYSKRLQMEQKEHNAQLEKLLSGQPMDILEKNPLLTKGSLSDKVGTAPAPGSFGLKKDGIFIEKKEEDKKSENTKSISEQLKEKMRKESAPEKTTEEAKVVEEEKKDETKEEKKDEVKEENKEVQPPVVEENKAEEKKQEAVPVENKEEVKDVKPAEAPLVTQETIKQETAPIIKDDPVKVEDAPVVVEEEKKN